MKYQDLVTKRTWEQDGEQRVKWLNIGTLRTTNDGKQYVELNILPNTPIYVFDQKNKNEQAQSQVREESVDVDRGL